MIKSILNPDGSVALSIGKESLSFTAQELEEQIERLGRIRAQMHEKVSSEPALIETVIFNPVYNVRTDSMTKACLFSVRHAGYGWLHFEFSPQEAINLKKIWTSIIKKLGLEIYTELYEGPERRLTKPH